MISSVAQSTGSLGNSQDLYRDRRVAYIGHGKLESSSENLSSLHVISHELGHAQEFRSQALRDHSEIRSLDVKIHYENRNGKLVAVSGETSVLSAKKEEIGDRKELQPYTNGKSMSDLLKGDGSAKSIDPRRINETEKKEELENKIKSIEDLLQSEMKFDYLQKKEDSAKEKVGMKDRPDFYKEEMIREKKRLEEEVRLLKMQEETRKTFAMLTDIQRSMLANVFGMMQIGSENLSPGTLLETFI